jgi:hypothetical protein
VKNLSGALPTPNLTGKNYTKLERLAKDKLSSLFCLVISYEEETFLQLAPRAVAAGWADSRVWQWLSKILLLGLWPIQGILF